MSVAKKHLLWKIRIERLAVVGWLLDYGGDFWQLCDN
jgi:hypothetical protein